MGVDEPTQLVYSAEEVAQYKALFEQVCMCLCLCVRVGMGGDRCCVDTHKDING